MIKFKHLKLAIFLISFLFMTGIDGHAQKKKKKKTEEVKEKKETIESKTKGFKKMEGLFTFYRDSTNGDLMMEVTQEQLDKEYIYFSQIDDGVVEASSFRGLYRGSSIFRIEKYFDKLDFVKVNTSYYYDENNPLSKSSDANISHSLLATEKIEVSNDNRYLIKGNDLFLKETWLQIKPSKNSKNDSKRFKLGSLSSDKTKIRAIKNYPNNVNFKVEYVYSNPSVSNYGSNAVTDARNVSISVFHSLVEMPTNNYKPRFDDPRVGYFTTQVDDMTTTEAIQYRDMINRWHLEKKNPDEDISEPVEPITWWIENTTPYEFRETIKQGVLEWNKAFEKIGFKNAIEVKIQPDDANWDAGDIRYNVLRWTSSPQPPFGGYGPSFKNPRTGQIIGADIMLEFVHFTNRVRYTKLYDMSTSNLNEDDLSDSFSNEYQCSLSDMLQMNTLFGQVVLDNQYEENDFEMEGMKKEAMLELIMHEVGHTLGLNHNMKSSQLYSPNQLYDKNFIKGKSLTGSVMDYATINVTRDKNNQGHYYSTVIGPYDEWAIAYGYTPNLSDDKLNNLLNQSTKPENTFGNDADDMRSSLRGIDPRINVGDMSNDQIRYSIDRIGLVKDLMKDLKEKYSDDGQSYQELRQAFLTLFYHHIQASRVVSRFVGGVYVDRAMQGQEGGTKPYTPVSMEKQKLAMKTLEKHLFGPVSFDQYKDIYDYLALQRRGFNFYKSPEDPKIHNMILKAQKSILNHLLHPNTLQRISDSQLYGNQYELAEFMKDLNNMMFRADANTKVNSIRQNLQIEYTKMLSDILLDNQSKKYNNLTRSMSVYNLQSIKELNKNLKSNDISTQAHRNHLNLIIDNALKDYK